MKFTLFRRSDHIHEEQVPGHVLYDRKGDPIETSDRPFDEAGVEERGLTAGSGQSFNKRPEGFISSLLRKRFRL